MNSGRLLADHILQHIGSERSDPIREMHFLDVELFGWTSWKKVDGSHGFFFNGRHGISFTARPLGRRPARPLDRPLDLLPLRFAKRRK